MWLLTLLPDSVLLYVVNIVLIAGAVGSFLSFFVLHKILNKFPALAPYHLLIQIVSAVLLVAGLYFKGGYSVEMEWRERVREMEAKVAESEAKSEQANADLSKALKQKTKIVKQVQVVVKEKIVREAAKMDATCTVDSTAISILNEAARGRKGTVTVGPVEAAK